MTAIPLGAAVERIYVHSAIYDEFVKEFVEVAKQLKLGDPSKPDTTLGPVVSVASGSRIRKQIKDASMCFLSFFTVLV